MPVKRNKLRTAWIAASLSIMLYTSGCTDNTQLKQDMLQAAAKQEQLTSYRFNGSVELKADASLLGQTSPMITALFALIKDSKLEYSGLTALDSSRMESEVKVTPAGAALIDIPILIKDSKLYFHMPPLNQTDEYMVLPLGTPSGTGPGNAESLKNTGRLTSDLSKKLWEGIDPNWLSTPKEAIALPDGSSGKKITLTVNEKNEQAFAAYWSTVVPGLVELLKTNGLAGDAMAKGWTATLKQIRLKSPSTLEAVIDNQGFIREQRWSLTFTSGGSTNESTIVWTQSLSELNQSPAFTKDIPAKQKSLEALLKLINPAPQAQK